MISRLTSGLLAVAGVLAFAGAAPAQQAQFERPAAFDATKILGGAASGQNYSVANPIASDGFMRIYNLRTSYGAFVVIGDALMRARLQELAALAQLDKVNQNDAFGKSFVDSAVAPVTYAGKLLTDPANTVNNTFTGVGNFFGQVGSSMNNAGKTQDDTMQSLFGVTSKKRALAAELHVDPYTDFEPLAAKLTSQSEAAAGASLIVSVGYAVIPGAAGAVISNVGTTNDMSRYARDYNAAQLMDMNRAKSIAMGLDKATTETLVTNRAFSPLDLLATVNALESMADVDGRAEFLRRAAVVNRRDAAFFMRRHAEILASYQAKTHALVSFVLLGDFPFNRTRGGGLLGLWPVDALSWTQTSAAPLQRMSEALKQTGANSAEIRISGQATALAKQKLQAQGFKVSDNVKL